ncbi:DUF4350 domain-containing protein [Archaeoglobus veneficus]|nr:DUF4350 domain-containing protein [Archaeoglobus veneficus]
MKVAWDASHGEFTIEDYYYFSKLKRYAGQEGVEIVEIKSFSRLASYDTIVFNYPEIRFRKWEIGRIKAWLKRGKRIIFAAYYSNLDGVAENVNRVLAKVSDVRVNYDVIVDDSNNHGDSMYPKAVCRGMELVMPCSASVSGGEPFVTSASGAVFGTRDGNLFVLGTCVFWDNFSIGLADNRKFSLKLLKGEL